MATTKNTPRQISWILAAGLGIALASVVFARVRKPSELAVYVTASERMAGGEEIYRPSDGKAFTYPPFFTIPFMPLAHVPEKVQAPVWWAVNLSLAGLAVWLVFALTATTREKSAAGKSALWWSTGITGLLSAKFMLLPLVYGSHDLLILVLMLASGLALARSRQLSAGLCGGIAAACKATPLLLLPFLIWQRQTRATAVFLATVVIATFLPDLWFPHPSHKLWVEGWYSNFVAKVNVGAAPEASGAWREWNELNQSLAGTIHRLATPAPSVRSQLNVAILPINKTQAKLATLALDCVVLAFSAWLSWPRTRLIASVGQDGLMSLGYTSAVLCGMLLLSPMSSTYHFCLVLPPIAFLVTYWMYCERNLVVATALGMQLVVSLLGGDLFGRLADLALAAGLYTLDAAMLLAACGYVLAWRLPRLARNTSPESHQTLPDMRIPASWRAKAA
jgi:hypothetical protein